MDEADRADREVEINLAEAVRQRKPEGPQANGRCHWCDEVVADHQRWCDNDCRAYWERDQRRGVL